jgi:hypothetical protein
MQDEFLQNFLLTTLGAAFQFGAEMTAMNLTDADLNAWVARYDVAFAVWVDPAAPSGFALIAFKGYDKMLTGSDDGNLRMHAFPCNSRAMAEQLLARFGDPAWPSQFNSTNVKPN